MENFIGVCVGVMSCISVILSAIWLIIVLANKSALKSKFVLPLVLCGIWLCVVVMQGISQNILGMIAALLNILIFGVNCLLNFLDYIWDKKAKKIFEGNEILGNTNKEDVIYADFVEKN